MNKKNKYLILLLLLVAGLGMIIVKLINNDKFYSHAQQQSSTEFTIKKVDEEGNKLANVEFEIYGKPTFSYRTEKVAINIEKKWEDNNNELGLRPENVKVKIYKGGEELQEVTLSEANNWKYRISGLEKYEGEELIVYTIDEEDIEYYTKEIDGYTITNTIDSSLKRMSINKTWDFSDLICGFIPNNQLNLKEYEKKYLNMINIKNNILKDVYSEFIITGSDGSYQKVKGKKLKDMEINLTYSNPQKINNEEYITPNIIGNEEIFFVGKDEVEYEIEERMTLEEIVTSGFEFEYQKYENLNIINYVETERYISTDNKENVKLKLYNKTENDVNPVVMFSITDKEENLSTEFISYLNESFVGEYYVECFPEESQVQ